jgi:hypothetical protein
MANTTNFGWETPDDTDLVKDGAAAMRTLGNSIDASLVDLKGGTTGQVLAKASNTDLDYSWTTIAAGSLTQLATGTLTGASVTTGTLSSAYKNLLIVLVDPLPANDGAACAIRFNSDSTSNYGSSTSTIPTFTNWPATYFTMSGTMDNSVGNNIAVATVYNYNDAIYKMVDSLAITVNSSTTTDTNGRKGFGAWGSTAAITTVTILPDSGNWTSGTYYVYGVN